MMYKPKVRLIVFLAACLCLLFSFVPNSNASQRGFTVQPEVVQFFLSIVGLETQIVDFDREDGFDRALYIDNLGNDPIIIGFPEAGIGKGVPFLLTMEGEEIVVRVSEDGRLKDIAGNEVVMPAGIAEYVVCMSDLVTFMRLSLSMGELCPPDASDSDCFSGALVFISYFFRGTIQCLLLLF